jgi:hypothetical protein
MKVVVWVLAIPAVQGCGSKVAPSPSPASPTTTAVGSATSTHVEETPRAEATVIFETDQGRRKASFVSREPPRVEGGLYWLRLKAQDGSFLVVGINGFAEGAVAPTVLYVGRTIAESTLAAQELEFENEQSVQYMCSIPNVHRMATSFSSAGAAGLNYFDTLLDIKDDEMRNRVALYEPDYLVAYVTSKLGSGPLDDLKAAWGERSLPWGLLQLAGSELAYYDAAELIAKYYSLGVHTGDDGKVDRVEHDKAFIHMLAAAERNARASAHAAKIAAGAIPVQAKLAYQLATVERDGDLGDKLDALAEYWAASAFSQTAVMLARN